MISAPRICAVILSAGASSRIGAEKALLPWPPGVEPASQGTLLAAQIRALARHAEQVVVVAGRNAGLLASVAESCGARLTVNPDPERGQFSSLQVGLHAVLDRECNAAVITPVDCPPLGSGQLGRLAAAFQSALARGFWAVVPESDGDRGHPLFAARPLIDAFLRAPVSSNARLVLGENADRIESVAIPGARFDQQLNTPEDYAVLAARYASRRH